jgi:aspartyl protease family protein
MTRILALALALASQPAMAVDINVIALTAGRAVVSINGGKIQTLKVGQVTPEGVKLLAASSESASFESDGKRRTLTLGQAIAIGEVPLRAQRATLTADPGGHFFTTAAINGVPLRLMVDTGATLVTLNSADAKRAGINYLAGQKGFLQTANGPVPAYRVKIDTVRLGDLALNNVDGAVVEGNFMGEAGLLGLSFLNRVDMRREGESMTLTRRY